MASANKFRRGSFITPLVTVLCVAADYAAKTWARTNLTPGVNVDFIPGFLHFTLTANRGAAFSLGSGNSVLMSSLASVMTLVLIGWSIKRETTEVVPLIDRIGMGCLLGGAFGNLLDRFAYGRVTDFLEFSFVSFPIFNVADVLIDVGIGLMLLTALMRSDQDKKPTVDKLEQAQ